MPSPTFDGTMDGEVRLTFDPDGRPVLVPVRLPRRQADEVSPLPCFLAEECDDERGLLAFMDDGEFGEDSDGQPMDLLDAVEGHGGGTSASLEVEVHSDIASPSLMVVLSPCPHQTLKRRFTLELSREEKGKRWAPETVELGSRRPGVVELKTELVHVPPASVESGSRPAVVERCSHGGVASAAIGIGDFPAGDGVKPALENCKGISFDAPVTIGVAAGGRVERGSRPSSIDRHVVAVERPLLSGRRSQVGAGERDRRWRGEGFFGTLCTGDRRRDVPLVEPGSQGYSAPLVLSTVQPSRPVEPRSRHDAMLPRSDEVERSSLYADGCVPVPRSGPTVGNKARKTQRRRTDGPEGTTDPEAATGTLAGGSMSCAVAHWVARRDNSTRPGRRGYSPLGDPAVYEVFVASRPLIGGYPVPLKGLVEDGADAGCGSGVLICIGFQLGSGSSGGPVGPGGKVFIGVQLGLGSCGGPVPVFNGLGALGPVELGGSFREMEDDLLAEEAPVQSRS